MKELSLNILDIAKNSVKAGATEIAIALTETDETLVIAITDNGCGMKPDFLAAVTDPFTTTRKTRKVGLGLPFFKMESEMTGGRFHIESRDEETHPNDHGTKVEASFIKTHLDFIPLGDIVSTVAVLIQGDDGIRWIFTHLLPDGREVALDTDELKAVLGDDVPLSSPEVIAWLTGYLEEQYAGEE